MCIVTNTILLLYVCAFQIKVKTKNADLKMKMEFVQVCIRFHCHFTNVLVSLISSEINGTKKMLHNRLTFNISIFKDYNLLSK